MVAVSFVDPSLYTDASDWEHDPKRTLAEIEHHLKALGDRYLPSYDVLSIEVLNVALAGRPQLRSASGVRVMTGEADWPRIELRYRFAASGRSARVSKETVVDMAYLRRLEPKYALTSLPYEKRMLDEWFKARFVGNPSAR